MARSNLIGWLYTSVRFAAAKALRSRARRLNHETEAHAMQKILSAPSSAEANWNELRPVLDEAMHELGETDREAILLRFFEGRSLAEIGATVGVAENTARMRVDRALEKLHARLARRGITSTAAALSAALAAQPAMAAPAGLAGTIAGASLAGRLGAGEISETLKTMNTLKLLVGMTAAGAVGGIGTYAVMHTQQQNRDTASAAQVTAATTTVASLHTENQQLKNEVERLRAAAAVPPAPAPLAELHALVTAEQQKLIQPLTTLLKTTKGQLAPPVVDLFNLNADEKAALEKELKTMRDDLDTLAAANVTSVERQSETTVMLHFNLFAEAGGKVHDRLIEVLGKTLGPERESALMILMGDKFDMSVGNGFGAAQRTVTVQRQAMTSLNRPTPAASYVVMDRAFSPDSRMGPISSSITQVQNRVSLEENFAALAKLLPVDF